MNFLITFALSTERAIRQLASLVGHEVTTLGKYQVLKVQNLPRGQCLKLKKETETKNTSVLTKTHRGGEKHSAENAANFLPVFGKKLRAQIFLIRRCKIFYMATLTPHTPTTTSE